jgi:phosphohistidine phosphatase
MEICLVRHAIAAERGAAYADDALRPLTAKGKTRMAEAARGLHTLFVPDVVLTSPLVRARQTADILLAEYGLHKARIAEALATGDNVQLLEDLADVDADRVALVGHEPHMSATLSWLLTGDEGAVSVEFRKGAAALVSSVAGPRGGGCVLEWVVQPGALRRMASGQ